jgi:hypothetical protein
MPSPALSFLLLIIYSRYKPLIRYVTWKCFLSVVFLLLPFFLEVLKIQLRAS